MSGHVAHVELDEDKLSVTRGSVTVQLLPKEFDLLAYLQQHTGRVLTRRQLLDAVWPNQDPIDRTVDDHVYRLRKKLERLHSHHGGIVIETVRGRGYRLAAVMQPSDTKVNPVLRSDGYQEQIRDMLHQYVLYSHGAALQTMASQSQIFGVDQNRELFLRTQFQAGNFHTVADDRQSTFEQRLFYLLCLYRTIHADHKESLNAIQSSVNRYLLPTEFHLEVQCFDIPTLYMELGDLESAEQMVADAVFMTEAMNLDGYRPAIRLLEITLNIYRNRLMDARSGLDATEQLLTRFPWQRELAYYRIAEGMLTLADGRKVKGQRMILEGLDQLEQVGIPGHILMRVQQQLHFVRHVVPNDSLQQELTRRWRALSKTYDFPALEHSIEVQLVKNGLLRQE